MPLLNFGKIFISHSSADKPFVRRLARRLEKNGYSVWLDEKELRVGDKLSAEISSALSSSPVVLVVVSPSSVKSKWLRYELNIATERMIKGECRVIPALIDEVTPPPEVSGLLYADFRKGFAFGIRAITSALEYEKQTRLAAAPFYVRADAAVRRVFGGIGYASTVGAYKSDDWEVVSVPRGGSGNTEDVDIQYDCVSAYGKSREPLTTGWLSELHDFADKIDHPFNLIVTNCPVSVVVIRPNKSFPQVSYMQRSRGRSFTAFVELFNVPDDQWDAVLKAARRLLTELIQNQS